MDDSNSATGGNESPPDGSSTPANRSASAGIETGLEAAIDLASTLGDRLRTRGDTLAVAESCTGGLLGGALTAVPGSSDYFESGHTVYAYDAKRRHLAVSRESLDEYGAVSEAVALEMARGVREVADVTWGVSITGIAGPGGGSTETPVGTVYVGVAYAGPWGTESSYAHAQRHHFDGDRRSVRHQSVIVALEAVLEALEDASDESA